MPQSVSILDVAAAAGVSKSTASRALLGASDVARKTREHVAAIAAELGYVKDFHAHALKSHTSRTIAIYVRSVQLGFYGELIASVQAEVEKAGYRLAITSESGSTMKPLESVLALRPAGVIVASGRVPLDGFAQHQRIPMVVAGPNGEFSSLSSVSDDLEGARVLAALVVEAGHRRVGVVDVPESRSRTLGPRSAAMRAELLRLGVEAVSIDTSGAEDRPDPESLRIAANSVTAIMCPNDPTLLSAAEMLQAWGVGVPEDMSLTGYDGIGLLASPVIGLTTWEQPVVEISRELSAELLARIGDPTATPRHVRLTGRVIRGRTLAATRR